MVLQVKQRNIVITLHLYCHHFLEKVLVLISWSKFINRPAILLNSEVGNARNTDILRHIHQLARQTHNYSCNFIICHQEEGSLQSIVQGTHGITQHMGLKGLAAQVLGIQQLYFTRTTNFLQADAYPRLFTRAWLASVGMLPNNLHLPKASNIKCSHAYKLLKSTTYLLNILSTAWIWGVEEVYGGLGSFLCIPHEDVALQSYQHMLQTPRPPRTAIDGRPHIARISQSNIHTW
ncbi:hypothetical protein E2C01_024201 [Portunus trituberculatus]|uniref:Uncharacterized protein n=1 Tax=Portunus trituberculatus TaxID=210409 RepID=A0A5B7EC27_PORTR|nr:hypothetical protein [Portunus trituberculatus]